jgi:hypothetical protein
MEILTLVGEFIVSEQIEKLIYKALGVPDPKKVKLLGRALVYGSGMVAAQVIVNQVAIYGRKGFEQLKSKFNKQSIEN